jgi:peptidoglycan/xylan/chitin deacetylase (PgdA/CDA1 family)
MIVRLLKLIIAVIFLAVYKIYILLQKLHGKKIPPTLVIITYHSIKTEHRTKFERQMNALLKTGSPVSLDSNLNLLKNGTNIAISFDDAYQSVLYNAIPILCEKNIPATIFVPTGFLGKRPGWIKNEAHPYANEIVMTEKQLKTLPGYLITLGSHSVSHINLTQTDVQMAKEEIFESKQTLEQIIKKEVAFFAAPFATINEMFLPLFKEAKYQRVFLNIPTFPSTKTDMYLLGRTSIEPTDWPIEYHLKLKGAYQWLPLAISLKKKLLV